MAANPGASFAQYMERVPSAFAVTRGADHVLIYANAEFRRLVGANGAALGSPIARAFANRDASGLTELLDRAARTGLVARNCRINSAIERDDEGSGVLYCTVWPERNGAAEPAYLIIEFREASQGDLTHDLQRMVAERMLLSALEQRDLASGAAARAAFLAAEAIRLAGSLDENATSDAMAKMSLRDVAPWCIVDLLDDDGTVRRLAIIHPDPATQPLVRDLEDRWRRETDDGFGVSAVMRGARTVMIIDDIDSPIAAAMHSPETLRTLRALGVGPLLTVPLVARQRILGAVTFVASEHGRPHAPEDVVLAEALARPLHSRRERRRRARQRARS